MRTLAETVITAAAVASGLPETSVYQELESAAKEKIMLPERRAEMAFGEEQLERQGWRVARIRAENPTTCRTRYAVYRASLPVRVLVRADDQAWLDAFCRAFLLALPSRLHDSAGNPVRIKAHRATRTGYTYATIRIEETPTQALHISFNGIIYKDEDTGFITQITIHPTYEVAT